MGNWLLLHPKSSPLFGSCPWLTGNLSSGKWWHLRFNPYLDVFITLTCSLFKSCLFEYQVVTDVDDVSGLEGALDEEDDDDVPDLVENFDEASKGEDVVKSEGNFSFFFTSSLTLSWSV